MLNKIFEKNIKSIITILVTGCWLFGGQLVFAFDQEYKEILSNQDTFIGQTVAFEAGTGDFLNITSENNEEICSLLKFDDVFLQDSMVVIDDADFLFEIVNPGGNFITGGDRQIKITPIKEAWQELSATWSNKPKYSFGDKYSSVISVNTDLGWHKINIKNIVKAWIDGDLQNQGFIICPNSVADDHSFFFRARESGFPKIAIKYHYPDVALGNPVDNQVKSGGNINIGGAIDAGAVDVDLVDDNKNQGTLKNDNIKQGNNKQNNSSIKSGQAISLIFPISNEEINTDKPIFKWKYVKKVIPGSKFVLVLRKSGDNNSWSEAITEGATSLLWKNSLEEGKYIWYIGEWQVDRVVQQSPESFFVVNKSRVQQKSQITVSNKEQKNEEEITKNDIKNNQRGILKNKVLPGIFFLLFVLVLQLSFVLYKLYKNKIENKKIKKSNKVVSK
jgi:hypothetical protein